MSKAAGGLLVVLAPLTSPAQPLSANRAASAPTSMSIRPSHKFGISRGHLCVCLGGATSRPFTGFSRCCSLERKPWAYSHAKNWRDILLSFAPIIFSGRRSGRSRKRVPKPSLCRCHGLALAPLHVDDREMSALLTTGERNRFGAGLKWGSHTFRAVSSGQLPTPDWTKTALTDGKPFAIQARGSAKTLQDSRENLLVFKGMPPIRFCGLL
jgi:hypothetical protein